MSELLEKPKTNLQYLLYEAIIGETLSMKTHGWMQGFRMRLSELRRLGIEFNETKIHAVNKYGNSYTFIEHRLIEQDRENAIEIYLKLKQKQRRK